MMNTKLNDICDFYNGGAWSDKEYVEGGIPVLKVSNCKPQGFQINDINYLPLSAKGKYYKNKLQLGDVIIATVGSHPNLVDSAAGRSCIVNSQVEGFYLNQNAVCLRSKDEDVLYQKYLGCLCKEREFRHYIQNKGRGAANQMRIAIGAIKDFEFNLPPIETQKRIADILSAYDDLIENNQKQIKLLEEMAQRLYKEWFVDLRFPNYENTKIVDGVPVGWEVKKIKDVAKTTSGGTPSRGQPSFYNNGTNMWIKTKELQDGFLFDSEEKISNEAIKRSSAKMFEANSLLVAMYGATIGKLGISSESSTCNQACCVFEPSKSNLPIEFIYCWLFQDRQKLISAGKGSAQPNLSQVIIGNFDILVPSETVINDFNGIVPFLFKKKRELQRQICFLQQARDRLLPKLMSGELEV